MILLIDIILKFNKLSISYASKLGGNIEIILLESIIFFSFYLNIFIFAQINLPLKNKEKLILELF